MLSERLSDIRSEAELSQKDIAKTLKVSQSNYSR